MAGRGAGQRMSREQCHKVCSEYQLCSTICAHHKNITDGPERGLYLNHRAFVRCKSISAMKSSCTRSESSIRQKASWGDMEGRAEPFSEVRGGRNPRKAGGLGGLRGGRPLFPSRARIFSIFPQWPKSQDFISSICCILCHMFSHIKKHT